jgi:hypothetical protein
MRGLFAGLGCAVLWLAGCGGDPGAGKATAPPVASAAPASASASGEPMPPQGRIPGGLPGRDAELVSPEEAAVVFLYFDVAGLTPPIDNWVEEDPRVKFAPGIEKAGKREALRAELRAGAAAVHGVGRIRITLRADLSDYDPSYSEFTVRALAPSSTIEYRAFDQKVAVKFANGRTAQIWKVPAEDAQALRDRIGNAGVDVDVLLAITGAQPGAGGGSLVTQVLEYELREARGGTALARVRVAP